MFSYILEVLELNLKILKPLLEENVTLQLFLQLIKFLSGCVIERFSEDWKKLKEEKLVLLNFFDQLEIYETNIDHFINQDGVEKPGLPKIFQSILEQRAETLSLLLTSEKEIFDEKIFKVSLFSFLR